MNPRRRKTPILTALIGGAVLVIVVGSILLYSRPSTKLASVENCTYVITSTSDINDGPVFHVTTSTITTSYMITASTNMTTGAVVASTTTVPYTTMVVTQTPTVANGTTTISRIGNPYVGEPYTVTCIYVK